MSDIYKIQTKRPDPKNLDVLKVYTLNCIDDNEQIELHFDSHDADEVCNALNAAEGQGQFYKTSL